VAGGDIHRAVVVELGGRRWFIKLNEEERLPLFEAEYRALAALADAGALRVPRPFFFGSDGRAAWLAMERLELRGAGDAGRLGRGLAALHRISGPAHGWPEDNFIGATPQHNGWLEPWAEFWWHRRMAPQFGWAIDKGARGLRRTAERLERALPRLLADHAPAPSLLHGDLWGGNHGYLPDGEPVLFDPASYYGDRETDLAMMALFGGFDAAVRRAYEQDFPLPAGHDRRRPLYQLYHVLNHYNLFGGGWLGRAEALAESLIAA
jgi:fructosamine-3-kinase